jgi:hypothetical protein
LAVGFFAVVAFVALSSIGTSQSAVAGSKTAPAVTLTAPVNGGTYPLPSNFIIPLRVAGTITEKISKQATVTVQVSTQPVPMPVSAVTSSGNDTWSSDIYAYVDSNSDIGNPVIGWNTLTIYYSDPVEKVKAQWTVKVYFQ